MFTKAVPSLVHSNGTATAPVAVTPATGSPRSKVMRKKGAGGAGAGPDFACPDASVDRTINSETLMGAKIALVITDLASSRNFAGTLQRYSSVLWRLHRLTKGQFVNGAVLEFDDA